MFTVHHNSNGLTHKRKFNFLHEAKSYINDYLYYYENFIDYIDFSKNMEIKTFEIYSKNNILVWSNKENLTFY